MYPSRRKKSLYDAYYFPGFTPVRDLKGRFGDRCARVIRLNRRSKKQIAGPAALPTEAGMIGGRARSGISPAAIIGSISRWRFAASTVGSAAR